MIFNLNGKQDRLMTSSSVIQRYLTAGRGEVTLVSPRSMKAHKYAFSSPRNKEDFPDNTIFVYVFHENHKFYLGMYDRFGFRLTRNSHFGEDTEAVKGARYIVRMAEDQKLVDRKAMLLYHSGKCCKCGRKLDSFDALKEGIGRKCLKKYNDLISVQESPWDGN